MKLFVHMFLVASTLFVNSFKGNVITTNLMSKKEYSNSSYDTLCQWNRT